MQTKSLYDLSNQYEILDELLNQTGEVETYETLKLVKELLASKVDSCVEYGNSLEDYKILVVNKRKALQALEKTIQNKIDRYDKYLIDCITDKSLSGEYSRITIRESVETEVDDLNESNVDISFVDLGLVRIDLVYKPLKPEIKNYLEAGNKLTWARLKKNRNVGFKIGKKVND